jgi:hypothetical protein
MLPGQEIRATQHPVDLQRDRRKLASARKLGDLLVVAAERTE